VSEHPVRLVVVDDLRRNRLTVFLRLILAFPHLIWVLLWTVVVIVASFANWIATLAAGTPPAGLHRFACRYIRYAAHLTAYLSLAANPYPGFTGDAGRYPIDVVLPEPASQPRVKTLVRLFLAIPALLISTALGGGGSVTYTSGARSRYGPSGGGALSGTAAVLGWFASVATGRMPKGLRDAAAYGVGYSAQMLAYLLLVTDRYPNSDPTALLAGVERPPAHPVHLVGDPDDLRRSRVTVFFRLLLALPHIVWLALWAIAAIFAAIANWFVTIVRGTPAQPLHAFLSRFVRYELHVYAFLYLVGNPFPGFTGVYGSYPLDLRLPPPGPQNRWKTGFRIVLAVPALLVNAALSWALLVSAVLTWFVALARGTAPWGLRNLSAYALRYAAQVGAYLALVTDTYPHASPLEGASPQLTLDDAA
jgi:hypothetical protein